MKFQHPSVTPCLTLLLMMGLALSPVYSATVSAEEVDAASKEKASLEEIPGLVKERPASGPYVETSRGFMVPYTATIPGTDVTFEMVPVPGGKFTMGSPEEEEGRSETDLPQTRVALGPYWVGRHEVTWSEYWKYMELNDDFAKLEAIETLLNGDKVSDERKGAVTKVVADNPRIATAIEEDPDHVDGVTAPTPLYDPTETYVSGKDPRQPAVSMTPYAARQYTKWLSRITGVDYRLPTEAEWEYAARAGSEGPYPFEKSELEEYAWYGDNSDGESKVVGQKKPNAWGLYDTLGNVAEWVVDEYREEPAAPPADKVLSWEEAIAWPTQATHRIVRGGHWDSGPEEVRLASRLYSEDEDWKGSDPNFPLSPWWYTDYPAMGIGFRLVRPLEPMSAELREKFWEIDHEDIASDVASRLESGRGKLGHVNPDLPALQHDLREEGVRQLIESKE